MKKICTYNSSDIYSAFFNSRMYLVNCIGLVSCCVPFDGFCLYRLSVKELSITGQNSTYIDGSVYIS